MRPESTPWREVAPVWDIRVVVPFIWNSGLAEIEFTAMLPDFGGVCGIVIDPDWSILEPHIDALIATGFGFSCVSIEGSDPSELGDILSDWGWTGRGQPKPAWLGDS